MGCVVVQVLGLLVVCSGTFELLYLVIGFFASLYLSILNTTNLYRFTIADISEEGLTAKEGLLLWVQKRTAPYVEDFFVKDFTSKLFYLTLVQPVGKMVFLSVH